MIDLVSTKAFGSCPLRHMARIARDCASSSFVRSVLETAGIDWPKKVFPVAGKPCGHCVFSCASLALGDSARNAGSEQFMVQVVGVGGVGAGWRATRSPVRPRP